jgi:hypothetical protein
MRHLEGIMVQVYVTRHAFASDPLIVMAEARRQALAEREAYRLGLRKEYSQEDDFMELHVSGPANAKMRAFLRALKGFRITGLTVDVETEKEALKLGNAAGEFEICVVKRRKA